MMDTIQVQLHRQQYEFIHGEARYRGFASGRGGGKTWAGAYDLIVRAEADRLYGMYAPSYPMLRDSTLRTFLELARGFGVLADLNRTETRVTLTNGAEILCRSLDDPERARGPNLSGAWIDEASLVPRAAFDIIIACLRQGGRAGWLSATFTPKGKQHWTFEVFGRGGADVELLQCPTSANPFVPAEFVESVRSQYTESYARQELGGLFIDLEGAIAKRVWFEILDSAPKAQFRVRGWDLAATEKKLATDDPDWTVGTLIAKANGRYYVEDVVRARVGPGGVDELIRSTAKQDGYGVWVRLPQDPGAAGKLALNALVKALAGYVVRSGAVTGDKVTRAMPLLAQAQHGNVSLVRGEWNRAFLDEVCSFPVGGHDDQVDSASDAFNELVNVLPPMVPARIRWGRVGS